jgi:tetratricopeptide (TPR) repeat protein
MTCSSNTISTPRLLAAIAALGLAATLPAAAAAGGAARAIAAAQVALTKGDGIAAEARLREARAAGAGDDAVRASMGEALLAQGDLGGARRWLAPARFTAATQAQGFWTLGRLELREGRLPEAGRALDRALAIAPRDPRMWTDIARLRLAGGERAQAIAAAEHALVLDPRNAEALAFRGVLVREQYGPVASLGWFDAALAAAPGTPAYLADRGATLGELGRASEALRDAREVHARQPGNPRTLYLQAVIAARGGSRPLARRLLERGGDRLREVPGALLLSGALALDAGNLNLAAVQLDRLLRIQPSNRLAAQLLARTLARGGDAAAVTERFAPLAARADASPYLLTRVARAYEELGRRDQAVPLLGRAAARPSATLVQVGDGIRAGQATGSPDALLTAGDFALIRGDRAGALAAYLRAGSLRFGERELFRIERALRLAGRHDEADRTLSAFAAQNPRNPAVVRALANAAAARGRWSEAARLLAWLDDYGGDRDAAVLADLSYALHRDGRREDAAVVAARATAVQPSRLTVRRVVGLSPSTAPARGGKAV